MQQDNSELYSPSKSSSGGESHRDKDKRKTLLNFLEDSDNESWGDSSSSGECINEGTFSEQVGADNFEEPCLPVVTSGGTASFFFVKYKSGKEPANQDLNHFVGKDLYHASDEIEFYDSLRETSEKDGRFANFAQMCMDCPGVCKLLCKNANDNSYDSRFLLLLENLCNGYEKMRLVDVKMGAETAVACWKGKTRLNAWKNARVDQRTNSSVEGFRLEGMECPPLCIQNRIDVVEVGSSNMMRSKLMSGKVAKRFLMQRLRAHEFMAAWCDLSELGIGAESQAHCAVWSAVEQVGNLLRLCLELPVPQQWIGSSIAVGVEVGRISKNPNVKVRVFDWGRAELCSIEHHESLTIDQRKTRLRYWRQYIKAVCRFYWELCRIAAHRCCCSSWKAFVFELRIEPVSIVRAAVMGKTVSEVRGIGVFQLPPKGIKGGCATVQTPLIVPTSSTTPSNTNSVVGILHSVISISEDARLGEGSVVIELRGVTQMPPDFDHSGTTFIVLRVIGFEHARDARLHVVKCCDGHSEPTPSGHAYALTTGPGEFISSVLVWENRFEFIGLGEESRGAQEKLWKIVAEGFKNGATRQSLNGVDRDASAWPEMFPPTVGNQSHFESNSQKFSHHLVSWLDEAAPLPKGWP